MIRPAALRDLVVAIAVAIVPGSARAQELARQASVIDGDTWDIHGTRIRLWGIDAPERDSFPYGCGAAPANKLDALRLPGSAGGTRGYRDTARSKPITAVSAFSPRTMNNVALGSGRLLGTKDCSELISQANDISIRVQPERYIGRLHANSSILACLRHADPTLRSGADTTGRRDMDGGNAKYARNIMVGSF